MSKIENFEIKIPQLGRTRTVWVYLPDNYSKKGNPLPVIYMHDGQNIFYDHLTAYGNAWHVDKTMDQIFRKYALSAVIVGVECNPDKRLSEYSPWKTSLPMKGFPAYNRGGEGKEYADFFVNDLICQVQKRYNVVCERVGRAVVGSSMGGLISLYLGIKHQNLFQTMGLFSTFTPFNVKECNKFLKNTSQVLPQNALVYCGGKEDISVSAKVMQKASIKLYQQLTERQISAELLINSDFKHNEAAWDVVFHKFALDFLQRYNHQL